MARAVVHQRDAMACGVQVPGDLGTDPGAGTGKGVASWLA